MYIIATINFTNFACFAYSDILCNYVDIQVSLKQGTVLDQDLDTWIKWAEILMFHQNWFWVGAVVVTQ